MPIVNNTVIAPFNTWTVSKFLGMGSVGDVSTVVQKALVGGGLAFDANGYLIAGKRPYWNIFSNFSPGQFLSTQSGPYKINFKIKDTNPKIAGVNFWNDLAGFEQYDHRSNSPSSYFEATNYSSTNQTYVYGSVTLGSYNFDRLADLWFAIVKPLYVGIRFNGTIERFNTEPYTLTNTGFEEGVSLDGNFNIVSVEVILKDSSSIPKIFRFEDAVNKASGEALSTTVIVKRPPTIIIQPELLYNQTDNAFNGIELRLYTESPFLENQTVTGRFVGTVMGMEDAAVRITNRNFNLTIPKGQNYSSLTHNTASSVIWDLLPQEKWSSVFIEVVVSTSTTNEYQKFNAHVDNPEK